MAFDDRRRHQRVMLRFALTLNFVDFEPAPVSVKGTAEDLSTGGLRARLTDAACKAAGLRVTRGLTVQTFLQLPAVAEPLVAEAEVAWVEYLPNADGSPGEWVFGLRFFEPPEGLEKALLRFQADSPRHSTASVRVTDILQGIKLSTEARRRQGDG